MATFELIIKGGDLVRPNVTTVDRVDIGIAEGRVAALETDLLALAGRESPT